MKFLIILHLAIMGQAQNTNMMHLNMKMNRLTRITDGLQKDVSDIWTIISTSGTGNIEFGNKTRTDTDYFKGKEEGAIVEVNGTINDVKALKSEVEQLILYSRNGFKNEKEFQREAISDLKKSYGDFQTNMTEENTKMKHNMEEMNTQVSDLHENSKNMSDIIQETNKNNQLRIQTLQLNLNKNVNKTVTHDVLLESMKKMLENLSEKQIRLEELNQELKQKIINMEGELTLLQSTTLCEKNWTSFNSHCYLFTPDKQSFDVALEACTSENSNLVEINSEAESKFLAQLNIWSYPSILVGATNIQEGYKGTFVYQESKLAVPEKFWNVGEPNNARGDEHCVEMFTVEEDLKFNDVPCSWSFPFVCEKPGALVAQSEN